VSDHRSIEGLVVASVGAAIAATALPRRLRFWGAVVAAANGWVAGYRGTYDWSRPAGVAAFVVDSSWSLTGTASGLALSAAQLVARDPGYRQQLSRRRNRQVYAGGVRMKPDFALTAGQVISNAAGRVGIDGDGSAATRRRRFVTGHEELHVWQQRAFGPLYPLIYGSWAMGAGAVAVAMWLRRGGDLPRTLMTLAYYDNPFEYWAYRNDGYWPPAGADASLAWRARAIAPSTPALSPSAGA
jgi:hypothetical protein